MRLLKLAFWCPVAILVIAAIYAAWLAGRATSRDWFWLTLLVGCFAVTMVQPLSWHGVAGAWTALAYRLFARRQAR